MFVDSNHERDRMRMGNIGRRIKEVRENLQMNQRAFGDALGVKINTVSNWEREIAYPPADKLALMRQSFAVDMNWLLTGNEEMGREETAVGDGSHSYVSTGLLESAIEMVEEGLLEKGRVLTPQRKARLITLICEYAHGAGKKVDWETVKKYLELVE